VKRQCQRVRLRAWWRFAIAATDRRSRHSAWQNRAKTRFAALQVSACAERPIAGAGQDNHSYLVIVVRGAIALGDTGNQIAIDGIAFVRPFDGNPERLPALF
jgi:hypothetical protein